MWSRAYLAFAWTESRSIEWKTASIYYNHFQEKTNFGSIGNGLQWSYSIQWFLMENVLIDNSFNRYLRFFHTEYLSAVRPNGDKSCSNFIYFRFHYVSLVHFRYYRAYFKFYSTCTLIAKKYTHPSSCFLLFLELNVNLNLKCKYQYRRVIVELQQDRLTCIFDATLSTHVDWAPCQYFGGDPTVNTLFFQLLNSSPWPSANGCSEGLDVQLINQVPFVLSFVIFCYVEGIDECHRGNGAEIVRLRNKIQGALIDWLFI